MIIYLPEKARPVNPHFLRISFVTSKDMMYIISYLKLSLLKLDALHKIKLELSK
jgi:hypothetical protein